MDRKILVCVDLSDYSREVLKGAQSISGSDDELVILYVVPDPSKFAGFYVPHGSTEKMLEELEGEAGRRMKRFVDRYARGASYIIVPGTPSEDIPEIAEREEADLIVIGSHQSSGWMDKIFSSRVSEKVVKHAPCPVEVVSLSVETEEELQSKPKM